MLRHRQQTTVISILKNTTALANFPELEEVVAK